MCGEPRRTAESNGLFGGAFDGTLAFECPERVHHSGLAAEPEMLLDFTRGGSESGGLLLSPDKIKNLLLAICQHTVHVNCIRMAKMGKKDFGGPGFLGTGCGSL